MGSVVDACVHPVVVQPSDLNDYLESPYAAERLTLPAGGIYPVPIDEYVAGSYPEGGGLPGSDPTLFARQVLDEPGVEYAILLPLTRGFVADVRFEVAIAAATNRWLADTWLDRRNKDCRYRGTIRVSARSPREAIEEIDRWADHPYFVQVGVPLESHLVYGEQVYFDIWQAAAERGLPVAVHADRAGGVLLPQTAQGHPQFYLEEFSQQPLYVMAHLCSLIAHGVFDRLPSLVFVFADGGFDYVQTLSWRMDKEWRSSREQVPWVSKSPRLYLPDHARFVLRQADGVEDPVAFAEFVELNDLSPLLMYGSSYPAWDHLDVSTVRASLPDGAREAVMSLNASRLYGLPAAVESR
jgi:predicted TIM-barrel fold metal-dependent hydrolase